MKFTIFFIISFFCGSFPTAYLVAKRLKGIDIRTQGSGNVGATNVFRVLGKGPGSFVFIVDFIKGTAPAYFLTRLLHVTPNAWAETALLLGVGSILGHVFTPFLNFRGGKGVATGAGVIFAAIPFAFFWAFLLWAGLFVASRTVSISSIGSLLALPIWCLVTQQSSRLLLTLSLLILFILWTHRSNITRLINRSEKSF